MKRIAFILILIVSTVQVFAQDMNYIKRTINTLCGTSFGGRGYVHNSRDKAARFIARQYAETGLRTFAGAPEYFQEYTFPVNTFPNRMDLVIGKKTLEAGAAYIVDARSSGFRMDERSKMQRVNLSRVKDTAAWTKLQADFKPGKVYCLQHLDTLAKRLHRSAASLLESLPAACYIVPQHAKLTWTVSTGVIPATVLYVADTAMPRGRKVTVNVEQKFLQDAPSKNVIGYIPGTEFADSFIVLTAHYDHLGKMGARAIFPGANDNASGTAFNLALAKYFAGKPPRYSVAFIATSGEEAGLLGSQYYVQHPVFPLEQIKLLINIDLMSDASDGITIVNAVQQRRAFDTLSRINRSMQLLSAVKSRDNAPNSDHFPFTQAGVPALFIYANGGKGYYHDVFDKPKEWSMNRVPEVFRLLTTFIEQQ
ncbi:M28 family metallopeptidase [Rurimicrobium arvi]|uniref:Peptidase M28 domain-containing protein n=1 Tax=Rurimicrobium arvi TaxID=2049916 RepID=A0ABP8MW98_9BACT